MKITEYFDIKSGKGEYTEEYIEKHNGPFPLVSGQTVEHGIIGYIDTYDYDFENCLTYTKDGEKSGTFFIRSGKFSLTSHVNALTVKDKYEDSIILEWFKYKYQPVFIKNVIGRFGVPSLPQDVLELIEVNIPDKKKQLEELNEYKRLDEKISSIKIKINQLEILIKELSHTAISIPKEETIEELYGEQLFDILSKNSGITEKYIYDNYDPRKEQLPIFNGSDSVWGFIPKDSKIDGNLLEFVLGM